MKKLITLSLVACLFAVTAIGCGSDTKSGTTKKDAGSSETTKKADK
ncbi:MAG: hypothetical protein ACJ8FY_06990 [Gemmataceae bacterium]